MLRKIKLSNFKCFENLDLTCASLNLLCGLNGMGKSSVIQALLVLRQSFKSGELLDGMLVLGGELVDLGTGVDVLFEDAQSDVVEFELHCQGNQRPWTLSFDYSRTADQLNARSRRSHRPPSYVPMEWREIPPFGGNLVYVNAERIGPRKLYERSETFARRGDLGARAEYAMNFLNEHQDDFLREGDPRCTDKQSRRLLDVVDQWLQEITPGAHLQLEAIAGADAIIAGFSFDRPGDVATRRYRATNVGFGLSYALPVVLALLAPEDTLCLIENPEAHLHPRGQAKLAELAARASIAGVQIIVETHSDHFMDGIRIAVREGLVRPEGTAFHYFERAGGMTAVTSPEVDADGRLSSWPVDFFDQHDENLARLLAPRS